MNKIDDMHRINNMAWMACYRGKIDDTEKLIKHHPELAQDISLLQLASQRGYISIVRLLVHSDANIHAVNNLALQTAAACGRFEVVEFLISCDANIHVNNEYALLCSIRRNDLKMVALLVLSGANLHMEYEHPLTLAVFYGHTQIVKFLLSYNANADTHANTLMKYALRPEVQCPVLVQMLLDAISNIDEIEPALYNRACTLTKHNIANNKIDHSWKRFMRRLFGRN